jgi:hypothetical protein
MTIGRKRRELGEEHPHDPILKVRPACSPVSSRRPPADDAAHAAPRAAESGGLLAIAERGAIVFLLFRAY